MRPLSLVLIPICALIAAPAEAAIGQLELEQVLEQYCQIPDQLAPLLQGVQDAPTAEQAAPKLKQLNAQIYSLAAQLKKIEAFSAQQRESLQKKFELRMRQQWGRVYDELYRIQRAQCYRHADFTYQFRTLCNILR